MKNQEFVFSEFQKVIKAMCDDGVINRRPHLSDEELANFLFESYFCMSFRRSKKAMPQVFCSGCKREE